MTEMQRRVGSSRVWSCAFFSFSQRQSRSRCVALKAALRLSLSLSCLSSDLRVLDFKCASHSREAEKKSLSWLVPCLSFYLKSRV